MPQPVPEASSLQERLSWLRAEVAKVVQDPRYTEDTAPPELRNKLSGLLRELADLRHGAEAVAAAAAGGGHLLPTGSPAPRRFQQAPAPAPAPVRESEWRFAQAQQLPSMARARSSSTPLRHHLQSNSSRFVGAGLAVGAAPVDWMAASSLRGDPASSVQPFLGGPTAPVLVCPHMAADLTDDLGDSARYVNRYDRYMDRERLAGDGVMRGGGLLGETAPSATPTMGRAAAAASAAPLGMMAPTPGAAPSSLGHGGQAAAWGMQAGSFLGPGNMSGVAASEASSAPAEEPAEVAPQGNMWRPMRSKISR